MVHEKYQTEANGQVTRALFLIHIHSCKIHSLNGRKALQCESSQAQGYIST